MGMNEQCKFCTHQNVCAYKEHYENVIELYEKAMAECSKYPWFKCKIECTQYRREYVHRNVEDGKID